MTHHPGKLLIGAIAIITICATLTALLVELA